MDVQNKVAVVTGASRGIGRAIALALAAAGADVVCTARSSEANPSKLPGTIDQTAREVEALGRHALAIPMNVAKDEEIEAMARRTLAEFGRIDILVNNAAVSAPGFIMDVPVKHWDLVMNVNVRGVYVCTRAFLPTMIDQRSGCIVNISSYASQAVGDYGLAYSVSKAALERMSTGLAAEVRSCNIAVNALQIERLVASEGFVYLTPGIDHSTWDDPKVVGEDVLWLVSQDPTYTGHVVTLGDIERQMAQA
jgi:NAD(P)-dependent dehydrogenase (short-subunit alcohol dehydrogenase family)